MLGSIERDLANRRVHHDQGREHEWRIAVRSFQDQLRECWERAVEDFVGPVFKRLSDKVDTKGLKRLVGLTDDHCRRVREGYGRCSSLLHSSPEELNPPLPRPEQIQAEIDEIRAWYGDMCVDR